MQKAIIHTATRVIRCITTDESPVVGDDESIVELVEPIDLADGPWKLNDANQKVTPTDDEIIDSGVESPIVDERKEALQQNYKTTLQALAEDETLPDNLKQFFTALNDLMR